MKTSKGYKWEGDIMLMSVLTKIKVQMIVCVCMYVFRLRVAAV